ncbi:MoaD/ThiS family protein [uncultured Microbacterium sp.]|uniref:MoaD/ThiS family protein n=1 Tax=uncultured Microbacterium sp. TaxID=191216 RepID=UPI0026277C26|nr:MoaD/ThiS family protein [uncultured Microbacterium sp.]
MAHIRYFAAAEEFAGRAAEHRGEPTLGALLEALTAAYPALGAILPRCAVLVDGRRNADDTALTADTVIDVLPPFAGG